ncbi:hypothetical protein Pcinc_042461 [Petrolisthes cinctipes]|uniref:Uncharacterized protein n=1 Tax=Petrolisthes cinctipes TaxID=88211 RepID=A0AAE1EH05_PETCI|nr:hypothetical protein Pcinc_042461 [Petrolisthes cinctipes]
MYNNSGSRGRSKSLTRDDLWLRSHPRKTVTYEDEVLQRLQQQPPKGVVSRSSLSIDKSVPYESDLEVREHIPQSLVHKSRAGLTGIHWGHRRGWQPSSGDRNFGLLRESSVEAGTPRDHRPPEVVPGVAAVPSGPVEESCSSVR